MKALVLNFSSFDSKDKSKSYFKFDLYDIDTRQLYPIFTEHQYCNLPDGIIPSPDEMKKTFPRIADVDFTIQQYTTKENKIAYSPRCNGINSWKYVDLKKL